MGSDPVGVLVPGEAYATQELPPGYAWCFWRDVGTTVADAAVGLAVLDLTVPRELRTQLGRFTSLKALQLASLGFDGIRNVPAGVTVHNAASSVEEATAETCLLGILVSLRQYQRHYSSALEHVWGGPRGRDRDRPWHERARGLSGKRVALLGYGSVGKAVAARIRAFNATVDAYARSARLVDGVEVGTFADFYPVRAEYDVVVSTLPLTSDTHRLVDADFLSGLSEGTLVANVGRGKVVDTDALVAELRAGRLAASLDVTDPEPLPADHPLWDCPNTVITPHSGGAADVVRTRYLELVARQVRAFVEGRQLANVVQPEASQFA